MKYGEGHWKWQKQAKLNGKYHHAKLDINYIYCVWVNPNVKGLDKPWYLNDEKHVNYLPWIHIRVTQIILCISFIMYVASIQHLNYRGQESKTRNLQLIFLTHLWPYTKSRSSHLQWQCRPKKGYNRAKFKGSCFSGVQEKANIKVFFSNEEIC